MNTAKISLLEVAENIKARRRANKRLSEQMAEKVSHFDCLISYRWRILATARSKTVAKANYVPTVFLISAV